MATPHIPPVNAAIHARGKGAARGALAALAAEIGVSRNAVSTWFSGRVTPDPAYWPAIERALSIAPGTLARTAAQFFDPTVPDLVPPSADVVPLRPRRPPQGPGPAAPAQPLPAAAKKNPGKRGTDRPAPRPAPAVGLDESES